MSAPFPWRCIADELPDADLTVMIHAPYADNPVWLGYLDDDTWRDVDGTEIDGVTHWADLPEPPPPIK